MKSFKRAKTADASHKPTQNMFTYVNNGVLQPYADIKVDQFYASRRD